MIQVYTWDVTLPQGRDVSETIALAEKIGAGIAGYTSFLRGTKAQPSGDDGITVAIRVYGKDRWSAQAHARQIAEKIFKASKLWGLEAILINVETEPTRRGL